MKITALIENKAPENLQREHGLAVHIAYKGRNYLLDTGSSDLFLQNTEQLGISLTDVDDAVLSHAHYDHSGGYEGFFQLNTKAVVYVQECAKESCYFKIIGPLKKYIGIPKGLLETHAERFRYIKGDYEIAPGVRLISHKTKNLDMRGRRAGMYRKKDGKILPDDFSHEQSLVFETAEGLVVLNSCCHAGIENIVTEVRQVYSDKEIAAVIGGFHLMGMTGPESMAMPVEEVEGLARKLVELGVHRIYTGHCTGGPAYEVLKRCLGDRIQYFSTGTTVEFLE